MNKFQSPDDPGFNAVAGQIEIILCDIRKGRPIDRADVWIRNKRYAMKDLEICWTVRLIWINCPVKDQWTDDAIRGIRLVSSESIRYLKLSFEIVNNNKSSQQQ